MNLTKSERSLLLYLECRATDDNGKVRGEQMNDEDFKIAYKWAAEGFIRFDRIPYDAIVNGNSHWVVLSDNAYMEAYRLRREKCNRGIERLEEYLMPYSDKPVVTTLFEGPSHA